MTDILRPDQRVRAMRANKSKDTSIEIAVRSALHRRGLRFRKHVQNLSGKPDIVFVTARIAVFVDGDFWHGYKFPKWGHKLSKYWIAKIEGNRVRDQKNFAKLRRQGWIVVRVWEHDVKRDLQAVVHRIESALVERGCC